jgi:predicted PurR-regulated permease PerM
MADEPITSDTPPRRTTPAGAALVIIALLVVGAAVTYLGPILKPFLIAVFLFFITQSAAHGLIRLRLPAWAAYLTLFILAVALIGVIGLFVYSEVLDFQAQWGNYQQRVVALVGDTGRIRHAFEGLLKVSSQDVMTYFVQTGAGLVEVVLMAFFYLLFFILGADRLPARVLRTFPGERGQNIIAIAESVSASMEQFMKVKTVVSLGLAVCAGVMMYLFGLRHWLLWSVCFFLLNYITYIGSIAACVPPCVFAYLDLAGRPIPATILATLIVANRILWIDYVEIRMSGKQLNIDSVLLLLWLAYWGWAWGVVGLLLAYPMLTSLKIILEHLDTTKRWAMLMRED